MGRISIGLSISSSFVDDSFRGINSIDKDSIAKRNARISIIRMPFLILKVIYDLRAAAPSKVIRTYVEADKILFYATSSLYYFDFC